MTTPFRVCVLDEVASTNDEVKRALAAGEAEGLVVRARRQTGGYGRQGRAWTSPEGGLYCSLLLRPAVAPVVLPTLSLVVGVVVRRAIVALAGEPAGETVQIKWPNDVVIARNDGEEAAFCPKITEFCQSQRIEDESPCFRETSHVSDQEFFSAPLRKAEVERSEVTEFGDFWPHSLTRNVSFAKLCGISCETHGGGVCVGVGVNVVPPAERPHVGGKNEPAYVADFANAPVTAERMLDAFLEAFAPLYERWQHDGFAPLLDEYNAHASLTGREVTIEDRNGSPLAAGTVTHVDVHGRLVLRTPDGTPLPITSGEAHIR